MIRKIKLLAKKTRTSHKKVHFWQQDVINFYFKVNQRRLYIQVKFVELSRRSQFILRFCTAIIVIVIAVTYVLPVFTELLADRSYALTSADTSLLPDADSVLQKDITYNAQSGAYDFQ